MVQVQPWLNSFPALQPGSAVGNDGRDFGDNAGGLLPRRRPDALAILQRRDGGLQYTHHVDLLRKLIQCQLDMPGKKTARRENALELLQLIGSGPFAVPEQVGYFFKIPVML
ncbi:hypothetical protein D3C71_1571350 [compost metagenome]